MLIQPTVSGFLCASSRISGSMSKSVRWKAALTATSDVSEGKVAVSGTTMGEPSGITMADSSP